LTKKIYPGAFLWFFCIVKPTNDQQMKTRNILLTGLVGLLFTGCFVKSLHPFYRDDEALFKKEMLGTWVGEDSSTWKIEQSMKSTGLFKPGVPENAYLITFTDKNGTSQFSVHLFKLGARLFLDFYPEEVKSTNDFMAAHLVPAHTVARVDLLKDKMVIQWYNEEWLIGLFRQNKIRIAHEKVPLEAGKSGDDNYQVVLTASTDDLQKFMMKYSDDPSAFKGDYTSVLRKKTGE
jgi:hypothetical protein